MDPPEVVQLKEARSKAKYNVTVAARRLKNAIARKSSQKTIDNFMLELERTVSDFEIADEDFCNAIDETDPSQTVVNGLDLHAYRQGVVDCYKEALFEFDKREEFKQTIHENVEIDAKDVRGGAERRTAHQPSSSRDGASVAQSSQTRDVPSSTTSASVIIPGPSAPQVSLAQTSAPVSHQPTVSPHMSSASSSSVPLTGNGVPASQSGPAQDFSSSRWYTGDIHLKKTSLPVFSGERKEWPEFQAVWKELAESTYRNKSALAYELKQSLKGAALDKVKNIYVTRADAYEAIWNRLSEYYDDVTASVQAALDGLQRLKPVQEDDYRGIVQLVDSVESTYAQLSELKQLQVLTMREVDKIAELLPSSVRMFWVRTYHQLDVSDKLNPLEKFMKFLEVERASVARLAENQKKIPPKVSSHATMGRENLVNSVSGRNSNRKNPSCVLHPSGKHKTDECRNFKSLGLDEKYRLLREAHACFRCFAYHRRDSCRCNDKCQHCNKTNHHTLMCRQSFESQPRSFRPETQDSLSRSVETINTNVHSASGPSSSSVYAIYQVPVLNCGKEATVFCDNGSNSTFITHRAAQRLQAKRLESYSLDVTTMGNVDKVYDTCLYEITLRTTSGRIVPVRAFGMEEITGRVSKLDVHALSKLFSEIDVQLLQRKSTVVDILLGCDYFGLHPKNEICSDGHLSVMQGDLGICLQGYHSNLSENTQLSSSLVKILHKSVLKTDCNLIGTVSHDEFHSPSDVLADITGSSGEGKLAQLHSTTFLCRSQCEKLSNFIEGEEIGTEVTPRCGGCRCSKCPSVGHTYSFREEQELKMIRENLKYDSDQSCWVTSYPWLKDPASLPDNYSAALSTLRSTEATLRKDPIWAAKYSEQITDMLDRKVARILSEEELQSWKGPYYYISHLAVKNPKSQSTPVRIVFNSSQVCQGVSLNSFLAKGPDAYMNNLLGLLLRWREEPVAIVGDIKKMFHSVHLDLQEQHVHRFLWRDLDSDSKPRVYVMTRVNMGDRPAPAICTEAIYKTAEMFEFESHLAAQVLRSSTYVDDIVDSFSDKSTAAEAVKNVETMLAKGGFKVKCWQFSGDKDATVQENAAVSLLKGSNELTRVLGLCWIPEADVVTFQVSLNFSPKRKGERSAPNLSVSDVPSKVPVVLTRRLVLEQVMMLFDPLGLICPFTLLGKINLRETWSLRLGWDDPLPVELRNKWLHFFTVLFQLEDIRYDRNLHPSNADPDAKPTLILFSDGSDKAYGFVAYIRWLMNDGSYWCRLVMAKSRIAPMRKLTTPQMELNGAVLSKRGRKVIEKELRFEFQHVLHIVDSETVLNMLHKTSTRFKIFEGVRIGEIQNATEGDMSCWAWLPGIQNSADLLTRGCDPKELGPDSNWWKGPTILYKPMEEWGLKFGQQREEVSPGEKVMSCVTDAGVKYGLSNVLNYDRYSEFRSVRWIVAILLSVGQLKSFKDAVRNISPAIMRRAELLIVRDAQDSVSEKLSQDKGAYSSLKPVKDSNGLWIIGRRLSRFNPLSPESDAQKLLPFNHPVTRLLMREAHVLGGHKGRDATLARFRQLYWTPHGSKLSWSIKTACQLCKLRDRQCLNQEMGLLPMARLKPAPAFTNVMLDLFGPYTVRGEVNRRASAKAYGVIFTDMVMRAVHIEAVFGYDTSSFLMAFSRFVSIRGWPSKIYSDPGSQLVCVNRELQKAWSKIDRGALAKRGLENGLEWSFGPADGPWHQGTVESLVKSAKRGIDFAVHNQRLSPSEFLTVCAEVSNLLNERPIGVMPSTDSEISVLTPNCLLLGRATSSNPGGWQPQGHCLKTRYYFVQNLVDSFWKHWTELCAPGLVVQRKWHTSHRNLQPGDVVIVSDSNTLRGEYRLGKVKETFPGKDGKVRKVSVMYKNFKVRDKSNKFVQNEVLVTRPIQRLALLVPADEK